MAFLKQRVLSIKRKECFRFLIGGGSAVLVDYLLYQVFLRIGIVAAGAKFLSFFCGAVVGFIINKCWTFERRGFVKEEVGKYLLLYSISAGVNAAVHQMLWFWIGKEEIAFLGATGVSTVLNFVGQKFFVFWRKGE